jgi:hypothetical protein
MNVRSLKQRKLEIAEVILWQEGRVVYVDFVLSSIINAVDKWYKEYYQGDTYNIALKAHVHYIISFYKRERFMDHETIGKERLKYLEEVDLYIQMKRED